MWSIYVYSRVRFCFSTLFLRYEVSFLLYMSVKFILSISVIVLTACHVFALSIFLECVTFFSWWGRMLQKLSSAYEHEVDLARKYEQEAELLPKCLLLTSVLQTTQLT